MKNKKILALLLILCLSVFCFTSCGSNQNTNTDTDTNTDSNSRGEAETADLSKIDLEIADDTSSSIDTDNTDSYTDGTTIKTEGTYVLTGNLTKTVTVNAKKCDVVLVLDNVNLSVSDAPAIYVANAKSVTIYVKAGTTNTISDGSSYNITKDDSTLDAAIFAKTDLIIEGSGKLTVNGNYKHGIVSKDTLTVTSGNITINSESAGLVGKDNVKISGGTLTINAGSDGIRSENEDDSTLGFIYITGGTFNITAGNDAIQAVNVIVIDGGTFTIEAGGGSHSSLSSSSESFKGIKAGSDIRIKDGTFTIDTADDAIHSNGTVTITGGTYIISSGDDGIHADNDLSISAGTINITKSYEGLEGSNIYISGGKISLVASDDGINAAGGTDSSGFGGGFGRDVFNQSSSGDYKLVISGGYTVINASGDGVDSNGTIEISGGVTLVSGPTSSGDAAFDYQTSATVTGGVLLALGSSGMAENVSSVSNQAAALLTFSSSVSPQNFAVVDSDGNVICSFTPAKQFQAVNVTCSGLKTGETYTIVLGGTPSNADENGYASSGTISGGTEVGTFTQSSDILGSGSGMGGGGNMGGGGMGGGGMGHGGFGR